MRVGIVGSRRRLDRETVRAIVRNLEPGTVVVSGGCVGPDTWAELEAKEAGLEFKKWPPVGIHPGMPYHERVEAYKDRNTWLVDDIDMLIALVSSDREGGTEDTIAKAHKRGIPVKLSLPRTPTALHKRTLKKQQALQVAQTTSIKS